MCVACWCMWCLCGACGWTCGRLACNVTAHVTPNPDHSWSSPAARPKAARLSAGRWLRTSQHTQSTPVAPWLWIRNLPVPLCTISESFLFVYRRCSFLKGADSSLLCLCFILASSPAFLRILVLSETPLMQQAQKYSLPGSRAAPYVGGWELMWVKLSIHTERQMWKMSPVKMSDSSRAVEEAAVQTCAELRCFHRTEGKVWIWGWAEGLEQDKISFLCRFYKMQHTDPAKTLVSKKSNFISHSVVKDLPWKWQREMFFIQHLSTITEKILRWL